MAHYVAFDKVMEEMNGEDSDWCDFGNDLVPDKLDGIDSYQLSKHHLVEDPLNRNCPEDTILDEAEESTVQPVSPLPSDEIHTVLPSASVSFMPVLGLR